MREKDTAVYKSLHVGTVRNRVEGRWIEVKGYKDNILTGKKEAVNFTVFSESVKDVIKFLVYNEINNSMLGDYTHFTHIDGKRLIKEIVEKAVNELQEYKGLCTGMVQLIAMDCIFYDVFN